MTVHGQTQDWCSKTHMDTSETSIVPRVVGFGLLLRLHGQEGFTDLVSSCFQQVLWPKETMLAAR